MDKLRVLYINHTGNVSGAEILIIRVTDELDPQYFEKIGMCPFDGKLHERFAEAMDHVESLPMQSTTTGFYSRFKQYASSMAAVYRVMVKHRVHLVHANSFRAALIAAPVGLFLGKPVIWHMYDILQPKLKNVFVVRLYSRMVKKIVAVSNATRDALLRVGAPKSKIKRIYNCLDREKIFENAQSDQELLVNPAGDGPKIVMSGQITPWKGQDVLLNAIPTILSTHPKAHFYFIGESHLPADKEFQAQLKEQAQAVGIEDKITWMGFRRDGLALLKQADIIVHCSVYPDPLPTVVMEGMALERLVIASDIGGVPEMVIDGVTGHLYSPGNSAALAKKIEEVLADPTEAAQMAKQAGERVAEIFTMDKNIKEILDLYKEALGTNRKHQLAAPQHEGNGRMI